MLKAVACVRGAKNLLAPFPGGWIHKRYRRKCVAWWLRNGNNTVAGVISRLFSAACDTQTEQMPDGSFVVDLVVGRRLQDCSAVDAEGLVVKMNGLLGALGIKVSVVSETAAAVPSALRVKFSLAPCRASLRVKHGRFRKTAKPQNRKTAKLQNRKTAEASVPKSRKTTQCQPARSHRFGRSPDTDRSALLRTRGAIRILRAEALPASGRRAKRARSASGSGRSTRNVAPLARWCRAVGISAFQPGIANGTSLADTLNSIPGATAPEFRSGSSSAPRQKREVSQRYRQSIPGVGNTRQPRKLPELRSFFFAS